MTTPIHPSQFQQRPYPRRDYQREGTQMSLVKVFEPVTFRSFFADRWSEFLKANYQSPEHVSVCFGVRFQTALNWWNGTNRPSGDVVAMAALRQPEVFQAHNWAAE